MRLEDWLEFVFPNRLRTSDYFVYSESAQHQLRLEQYLNVGGDRSDGYCHQAGDIYVHIGEWFDEREPDGNDDLYADSDQCLRLGDSYVDHYRPPG